MDAGVGQQEVGRRRLFVLAVAEHHVGEFVEHELLPMQRRLTSRVKDEVLGIRHQPQRADAVLVAQIREFHDPNRALSA
ncbi:hypothetical protein [Microbacterium sp. JZ37]|uniref:hypothetical protein n=1 Tax=Microbacterium sp. JZ37 TaxID=2654193 RepID=UPI002B49B15B|nr:hypothetical protein [Microbacterium sp. JZ37]